MILKIVYFQWFRECIMISGTLYEFMRNKKWNADDADDADYCDKI